jgi:AraC-like DNA-binding protein
VIYAPLSPDGARTAIALARETGGLVAFQASEEDFHLLVQNILSVGYPADARFVLGRIAPRVEVLPRRLQDAVVAMFTTEAGIRSPQALARRAALSRRSLDRWLGRAGITSGRLLVAAPMLLRGLRLLRDTRLSIRRVASASGYTSARRFHDQAVALAGMTPVELRTSGVPVQVVLSRVAASLMEDGVVPERAGDAARDAASARGRSAGRHAGTGDHTAAWTVHHG